MLIGALVLLAILTVPLSHGSWARLASFRPRGVWMLYAALGVQIVQFSIVNLGAFDKVAHLGTYVLAGAFLVVNREVRGIWLLAAGGLCNGLTIALNGGTLPARAGALRAAGLPVHRTDFVNSGVLAHPHLRWLGDVFAWPAPLPLHNVFSVGDVLLVVGAFVVVHRLGRWTPVVDRRAPQSPGVLLEPGPS